MLHNHRLCFIHIPKTAGTSAGLFLRETFGWDNVGFLYTGQEEQFAAIAADGIPENWRAAVGHFEMSTCIKYFNYPEFLFVSLIRDPVERIVSYYRHIRREPNPLTAFAPTGDINVDLPNSDVLQAMWRDEQVRYISPDGTLAGAVEEIRAGRLIIGPSNEASAFWLAIAERLGVKPAPFQRLRLADGETPDLDPKTVAFIRQLTENDRRLYDLAVSGLHH